MKTKSALTIGKRISIGFAGLIVIVLTLGAFALYEFRLIDREASRITQDCLPGMATIATISNKAQGNYILTLKHVLSSDAAEKRALFDTIEKNVAEITEQVAAYEKTITLARDRELFEQMKTARAGYVAAFKELITVSDQMKTEAALDVLHRRLEPAYAPLDKAIHGLVDFNRTNGIEAGRAITDRISAAKSAMLIGILAALVLGFAAAWLITHGTNRTLTSVATTLAAGAEQTAAAAAQVSASSQSLAEGASEQAASLEETSASLQEMASMTKRNAESATQAKDLSSQTRAAADTGAADMEQMKSAMDAIKASSGEIAKIVKTIDEIAFQTNILALNAAVEAARAGEAGAGFAVVAEEVRNLAQRSAQSAKETAAKIEDSVNKSDHGVQISAKVAASLQQIVERARKMDALVAEIAHASNEQTQGIGQVNTAVSQMDKVTQSNAGNAEETAAAAEELTAQAAVQRDAVAELLALVGGKTGATQTTASTLTPACTPVQTAARGQQKHTAAAHANGPHDDFFKDA
jgi:methyl-accepting chemotaxis protein